jgi:hypothetical protein
MIMIINICIIINQNYSSLQWDSLFYLLDIIIRVDDELNINFSIFNFYLILLSSSSSFFYIITFVYSIFSAFLDKLSLFSFSY